MNRTHLLLLAFLAVATTFSPRASAQATAYRQTNLTASSLGQNANFLSISLINPWSIAFLPGGDFFLAENGIGSLSAYDDAGRFTHSVLYPAPLDSTVAHSRPSAMVGDPNGNFGRVGARFQFIASSEDGTIAAFSLIDGVPTIAELVVDKSAEGAVYTGMTIINPACCNPKLAVANFRSGQIEVRDFSLVALPGSFTDPNLPAGYAPWNVQAIGSQVFVAYAKQNATQQQPVADPGNGIVSIFDQDGNFIRRFISEGGALNAPFGMAKATDNFGPFSNAILIGNFGDGTINAFDPGTGNLLGHVSDGEGKAITIPNLRALTFRPADGVGKPDNLYFVAGPRDGLDGLFGFISAGSVTTTTIQPIDDVLLADAGLVIATVTSASGTPTGTVSFFDGDEPLFPDNLGIGIAVLVFISNGNDAGDHVITARYNGDAVFLPSHDSRTLRVVAGPVASFSSGSLSFGEQFLNSSSAAQRLAIINAGGAPLSITGVQATTDFFVSSNNCTAPVPPLEQCTMGVSFRPSVIGSRTGTLTITDNSLVSPHFVALSGTGKDIAITLCRPGRPGIASLSPVSARQNSGPLPLTVDGCGFVQGAVVNFNGSPRPTTLVSDTQLAASLLPNDLATAGTGAISVVNPDPDGGSSESFLFAIDTATATSVSIPDPNVSIAAGQSGAVAVRATGFTGAITGDCLNAPMGVTCSYDPSRGSVAIQTAVSTAKGSYTVTVLLTSGASTRRRATSSLFALSLGLPFIVMGSVLVVCRAGVQQARWKGILPLLLLLLMVGCGGGPSDNGKPPATSAQASTALNLTIR